MTTSGSSSGSPSPSCCPRCARRPRSEQRRGLDDVWPQFEEAVNISPSKIESWLGTDESKAAGDHGSGGESIGHASGRHIVKILHARKGDLDDDDVAHMRKVVGYVHRHLAQRPKGDIEHSTWRHSLMNWGHDPLQ